MWLLLVHPELPTCENCKEYVYDATWKPTLIAGQVHAKRPPGTSTPCPICPKIPHGATPKPENAIELSDKNWAAYRHYRECKAVGSFPVEDAIVRRNADLIRQAEESHERTQGQAGVVRAVLGVFKK